ncbi:MAG TPA: hypothetical protein VNP04_19185 [Alphaproteobacteria bacterium]|nr:hypothetical protein [Alphaproteobacteria bacterium]
MYPNAPTSVAIRYRRGVRRTGLVQVCLLLALLCVGCATTAPLDETRLFSKAFYAVDGASQPLLDDLAVAERAQGQDNAVVKAKTDAYAGDCQGILWAEPGFIEGFCIDDAPYFAEIGDPPATRAFRQGVRLLGEYTEVLLILAEGRNVDEASAQVQALGGHIAGLASLAPIAAPVGPALVGVLGALQPIIEDAVQARNVEEMKRLVLEGAPHVKRLIETLRRAAPAVFNTIIYRSVKGATSPAALGNDTVAKGHLDRIAAYRIVVSNYVVLLGELERTFDQLVAAFQRPRSTVSLAELAQRSAQLTAHAEAWRRVYSLLRTGGQ